MTEGDPIHCHACAHFATIEDGKCSNCGAGPDEFTTPEQSAEVLRATVERLGLAAGAGRNPRPGMWSEKRE